MRKLLMMMALTAAVAVNAEEKVDTTVITNAQKVVIVTSDTAQTIQVVGGEGSEDYQQGKSVPLNEMKMRRLRKTKEKYDPWDTDFDLGVGVNTPLSVSEGYGFATFRSWEIFFGFNWGYTPEKALQTYSFGLWFDWKGYGLSTNKRMVKDQDNVVDLVDYPTGAQKGSSRIDMFSLSVPLLFTQKLGRTSKWSLTVGPVVNFNVRGRLNNYYEDNDVEYSESFKKLDYNVVTVDLMAAVRYKNLAFYCKYNPVNVFKKNKGPEFKSLTFGLYF